MQEAGQEAERRARWRARKGGGLIRAVRDAEQREARVEAEPEDDVAEELVALDRGHAPDGDERDLRELQREEIQPALSSAHMQPTQGKGTHRIFFVTIAMTSSCTAALSRKVKNIADERESL